MPSGTFVAMAHRGAHLKALENSLASIEAARRLGFSYVETDVRATADGQVVMFHDANARRVIGLDADISATTHADLENLSGVAQAVPTLESALTEFPSMRFNIDLKDIGAARLIGGIVGQDGRSTRVCIASFSTRRMRVARAALVGWSVCTSATPIEAFVFLTLGIPRSRVPFHVLQLPYGVAGLRLLWPWMVRRAHRAGVHVHVWTVNKEVQMRSALEMHVDGIVTDQPERLRSVLEELGTLGMTR
jgi:glycerophosphoryl diester phosphodiesterase